LWRRAGPGVGPSPVGVLFSAPQLLPFLILTSDILLPFRPHRPLGTRSSSPPPISQATSRTIYFSPDAGTIRRGTISGARSRFAETYKTIAQNEYGVPDEVSAYLLGHVPERMSQCYLLKWAMSSGTEIREAQAKISRTMVVLLRRN